jgi:arylsulfatase A-like enzyme
MDTNTVIIFTSDNGPHHEGGVDPNFFHSSGPFRGVKHELYEGGIRVPFIVKWPAKVKPGTTSDLPAALWDVLDTAAEMSGQPAPAGNQGISFLPTLRGETQTNRHEFLYWEIHDPAFKQAVRTGNWKAIRSGIDGPLELYDLKSDIGEKTNVAAAHPDIIAKITAFLRTARTEDKNWPTAAAAKNPK